jgi:hypothetical protein
MSWLLKRNSEILDLQLKVYSPCVRVFSMIIIFLVRCVTRHARNPQSIETFQGSKCWGGWGLKPGHKCIQKSKRNTVGFEPGSLLPAPACNCLPIELMAQTCDTGCQFYWPNNDRLRSNVWWFGCLHVLEREQPAIQTTTKIDISVRNDVVHA